MKTLIETEHDVTCKVCGKEGERLVFDDKTTQVQHPDEWHQVKNCYITVAHNNG